MVAGAAWEVAAEGVWLRLRVTPGAKADRLEGLEALADGAVVLKARVAAPAREGKANTALVKLIAKEMKLPKGAVTLAAGAGGRRKTLWLDGAGEVLAATLQARFGDPSVPGGS